MKKIYDKHKELEKDLAKLDLDFEQAGIDLQKEKISLQDYLECQRKHQARQQKLIDCFKEKLSS